MVEFVPVMLEKPEKPRSRALSSSQIASLVAQTGCLTFAAIFAFLGAGIGLDRLLHTRPLFTLLLVMGSMPLTLYALYRITVRAVAKTLPPPPAGVKGIDDDRDDNDNS
jgi:hypothetical protein